MEYTPGHEKLMEKTLTLYDSTLGKKAVLAVTGLMLFGFVIGHMLGNLQVFLGPDAMNDYAIKLHSLGGLLWVVRAILLGALLLHIMMVAQLYSRSLAARGVRYKVKKSIATTYAASTMWLSGVLLLLFVVYHLAHFTVPGVPMGNYEHLGYQHVYTNVINGFSVPWVVAIYVAAQVVLGMHLSHGAWSRMQTLGFSHPRYDGRKKQIARGLAALIVIGNISIPLAVLAGIVR